MISVADKHKSKLRRGGNTLAAVILLSLNIVAEMKQISPLSAQLHNFGVDRFSYLLKDWLAAFGLSQSAMLTAQMYIISMLTVLAVFWKDGHVAIIAQRNRTLFATLSTTQTHDKKAFDFGAARVDRLSRVKMLN